MNQIDNQFSLSSHCIYRVAHMVIHSESRWFATWEVRQSSFLLVFSLCRGHGGDWNDELFMLNNLPWTVSFVLVLLDPATLAAMQMYWPESPGWANAICRAPELRMCSRIDPIISCPSLCHVISGGGRPSASHGSMMGLSTAMIYSFGWGLMTGGTKTYKI